MRAYLTDEKVASYEAQKYPSRKRDWREAELKRLVGPGKVKAAAR